MITLVTGGSGSGKSAYARKPCLYYLAKESDIILQPCRFMMREGEKKSRGGIGNCGAGKGFLTIESPMNVGKIQFVCAGESGQAQYRQEAERKGQCSSEKKSALLECMSNLTANEMFTKDGMKSEEEVVEKLYLRYRLFHRNSTTL